MPRRSRLQRKRHRCAQTARAARWQRVGPYVHFRMERRPPVESVHTLCMSSETYEQLLDRAAQLYGIDHDFWDVWGRHHETSPEAKRAILCALGICADSPAQLENALRDRERAEWTRLLPPVLVVSESAPREFPIHIPAASGDIAQ